MEQQKKFIDPIFILGIILLFAGGLLLLDNFNITNYNFSSIIFSWQMIFIVIGLLIYTGSQNKVGLIFILFGIILLVPKALGFNVWALWPVILIFLGIYFLLGLYRRRSIISADSFNFKEGNKFNRNTIDEVAIFGGGEKSYKFDCFEGGKITAIFGGSEIDLYESRLASGVHYIDVTAIFGGFSLIVPKDWYIEIRVMPLFGGFSDQRRKDPNINYSKENVLIIKGLVLFGGGEIK